MNDYFTLDETQKNTLRGIFNKEDARRSPFATPDRAAVRRFRYRNDPNGLRTGFGIDIDKILNHPYYSHYADKTQVFSFQNNDEISRRSLHVQLVSRIARIIGRALQLNLELIEAIALGHDIGHTPFGHKGEDFLNELYNAKTGRHFKHNIHSVRVLKELSATNLTLQTYDGILCHCGEKAFDEYRPGQLASFEELDGLLEQCYVNPAVMDSMRPSTLEGCVVRISDMIAYVGKDRQDAARLKLAASDAFSTGGMLGDRNAEIINNLVANIVKNSLGKPYLKLDRDVYTALKGVTGENYHIIYDNPAVTDPYKLYVQPMMRNMYGQLVDDFKNRRYGSPIYQHHVNLSLYKHCYRDKDSHLLIDADTAVTDFIAGMTDDYFVALYRYLFPDDSLADALTTTPYNFDRRQSSSASDTTGTP